MIKIAHESLLNVKQDLKPLLTKHWSETEPNQDTIMLDPDWREYSRLDQEGILHIFAARDNGKLIGYCVVMISKSIHHKHHIFASTDVIYVKPEYRKSATGSELISFAALLIRIVLINLELDCPVIDLSFRNNEDLLIPMSKANCSTEKVGLSRFFLTIAIDFSINF